MRQNLALKIFLFAFVSFGVIISNVAAETKNTRTNSKAKFNFNKLNSKVTRKLVPASKVAYRSNSDANLKIQLNNYIAQANQWRAIVKEFHARVKFCKTKSYTKREIAICKSSWTVEYCMKRVFERCYSKIHLKYRAFNMYQYTKDFKAGIEKYFKSLTKNTCPISNC